MHNPDNFQQRDFQGFEDGALGSETAIAAVNTNFSFGADTTFIIAFTVEGSVDGGVGYRLLTHLQYQNVTQSTGWQDVTASSSHVRSSTATPSNNSAIGSAGSPLGNTPYTGSKSNYEAGLFDSDNGDAGVIATATMDFEDWTDIRQGIALRSADVNNGDEIQLRLRHSDISAEHTSETLTDYINIPTITASVGAGATEIATGLEAAVQEQLALAASIEAAIQARLTRETVFDTVLLEAQSRVASLDAGVQALRAETLSLDAALRDTLLRLTGLDSGVAVPKTSAVSFDAPVAEVAAKTLSIEAVVQAAKSVDASLDAALREALTVAAALDAHIQAAAAGKSATLNLDAALGVIQSLEANLSAVVEIARQATASLDAGIRQDQSLALILSAGLANARGLANTLDAVLARARSLAAALSAAILARQLVTLGLDAALGVPFSPRIPHRVPGRPRYEVAGRATHDVPERDTYGVGSDGRFYVIPPRGTVH